MSSHFLFYEICAAYVCIKCSSFRLGLKVNHFTFCLLNQFYLHGNHLDGSRSTITIPCWDEIKKEYRRSEAALQLGSILVKEDRSWIEPISAIDSEENAGVTSAENSSNEPVKPPTPLILATKYGCSDIALMIIDAHPQTVEQVGPKYGSILHLAIKYQRIEIFDAVMDMEMQMRKLVRLHDREGNTILHMVALNTRKVEVKNGTKATSSEKPKAKLLNPWDAEEIKDETRSPAFELQDDLLLFKVSLPTPM